MKKATFLRLEAMDYSGTEALNTICSNLSFTGRNLKKIVVTSCNPNDGKSFMTIQIARNLARRDRRVVVVDADLRKSNMVTRYGITSDDKMNGLAHYLAGYCSLESILFETNIPNMYLVPVGRDVANPVPLLNSPVFTDLINYLADQFDLVLVDAPPIGLVIDAAEIAGNCDGIVLVAKYNNTRRREMADAKWQLQQSGTPILGCILNDVTFDSISAKKYYNKSYYSHYGNYYRKSYTRKSSSGNSSSEK